MHVYTLKKRQSTLLHLKVEGPFTRFIVVSRLYKSDRPNAKLYDMSRNICDLREAFMMHKYIPAVANVADYIWHKFKVSPLSFAILPP
jgi:hypothetical protein